MLVHVCVELVAELCTGARAYLDKPHFPALARVPLVPSQSPSAACSRSIRAEYSVVLQLGSITADGKSDTGQLARLTGSSTTNNPPHSLLAGSLVVCSLLSPK